MSFLRPSIGADGKVAKKISKKEEKKRKLAADMEVEEPSGGIRKRMHADVDEQPSCNDDTIKLHFETNGSSLKHQFYLNDEECHIGR